MSKNYIKTFKENNLFDHILSIESLKSIQKSKIFELATNSVYSDFQFFLVNGTELEEEELHKIIVLYYKVQKDLDPEFLQKAKKFCDMNEAEGPTN